MGSGGIQDLIVTNKKTDSNESLRNDRILSRTSVFDFFDNIYHSCSYFVIHHINKATGQESFFRTDYKNHIDPLLNILFMHTTMRNHHDQFWNSVKGQDYTIERLLQHFYTGKDTRYFYDSLKEIVKNPDNSDLFNVFFDEYDKLRSKILNRSYVDFGACNDCIDNINLKHVKKHRKLLKKSNDSMWNFLFEHSESK